MSTTTSDAAGGAPVPDALAAQQALLTFAVAHSPVIFYVADVGGAHRVRFVSDNVEAITGHKAESFLKDPKYGRRHLHPEDIAGFDHALALMRKTGKASREYRMRSVNDGYMWFRDELELSDDGRQFVGSMTNVTPEKQAQDRLRDAEELNAAIIGTVRNAIIAADADGNVMDFNTSAERMFGYTRAEAMGRPLAGLIVPEAHREAHLAGIRRLADTGEAHMFGRTMETEAMRKDGSLFPVELNITCTRLNGHTVFVEEISDISERRAAEAERKRLGQLLQDAIENLPNGFAISDTTGKVILCNTPFARLYDRTPETMIATSRRDNIRTIRRQLRRFDGREVTGDQQDIDRIVARMDDAAKGPVEIELKDGRWMLVSQGSTADGGLVVVRTDITHQKQVEQALRDSEEHFRQIVENHPLPVLLFDVEGGRVLYESPAVSALLRRGTSAASTYRAMEYFPDPEERRRFVRTLRRDGQVSGFEARARLHDGAAGWVSISARMISYKGRDTVIASLVDLTERKAAEEALAASEARYRALVENAPVCIHEIDRDGRILSMNPRGLKIAGAPKVGPVIGARYIDLIHPDDQPQVADRLAAAMSGKRVEMEFRGFGGNGFFYSTKIPLRNDKGEVEKLIGVVIDITDRKRQETEIQRARETLEDAIESLPDGFALWDADDRLVTCNSRFREYNRSAADMLEPGVNWWDFMRAVARRGRLVEPGPENIERWVTDLRRELDGEDGTREFRDTEGRWFRAIARRTRQGGLVGIRSDISRYKMLEDALRDSEALVRQVLEACPVPILMTRLDGEILYESPAGRALFGRRAGTETAYTLQAWARPEDRKAYIQKLRGTGEVDEYEVLLRRPDGSFFEGAISARLINFKDEDVIVSSTRDLTETRAVAAEMERQREALYQGEKLSAMGQLLASVAHELNNPLSVVVGQSLLLQESGGEPGVVERAAKIGKAADRCARIVKTFLAMARQQPTEMTSVDLNKVVETALEVTGFGLRSHNIEVELDLAAGLPPAWADADQLNQVLTNLIVNAQQAMEGQAGPHRINIRSRCDPDRRELILVLADNGPGMPPEIRSRIFEPFFTTKDKGSGTGIGLAMSHRILAVHGGSISCDSEPGRGAAFTIRLPEGAAAGGPKRAVDKGRETVKLRILVVDDEPDVADVIAELLRSDGHAVEVAGSGGEALNRIEAGVFDLILSDIRMPELDGPGLYRRLRETRPELTSRLVFITGDTLSTRARQFLESCDCPRLEKPVTLKELRELLERIAPSS